MPQRFGQASDYGATFQYLASQNDSTLRSRAMAFDRRRQEEQAARDDLMFERYQQGIISGQEILSYIRTRINQTSYDKAQQRRWREAYIQYKSAVEDNEAEAAYAETGDINALISHYASKLRGSAKGSPERTEVAQRLRALREQRDSQSLQRGARRIARQIERGDASTKDLIEFYRNQLEKLPPGSPLRDQVRDALADAVAARRDEMFQVQMQKLDTRLDTGAISPQQAADRMKTIIDRFGLKERAPAEYWKYMDDINQMRATPDPVELAKLQTQVQTGQIPYSVFQEKLLAFADQIAPYNRTASWELINTAVMGIEGATPLPNPSAIGGSRAAKAIAHISQLDGSKYSQYNCTMAAAAMLAHAMGVTDLSGGDLRWASGVTTAPTNIAQAQAALRKSGVKGTRLSYDQRIGFEKFKKRVMNGAPAVLSGWNGDIDQRLNASGIIGGHAMFVAGYDPKRNAFLMLDPAKSRDRGTWWPASQVEAFGWGGERHGQALFAPRGTIDPSSLRNWKGARTIHVSVDDPPRRQGTPSSYVGQFDPGSFDVDSAPKAAAKAARRRTQERARRAGLPNDIQTTEAARAEMDRRTKDILANSPYVEAWAQQYANNPDQDVFEIAVGADTRTLSRDDITELQQEMLFLLDGQEMLAHSLEMPGEAEKIRQEKIELTARGVELNTLAHDYAEARVLSETTEAIRQAELSGDPAKVLDVIEQHVKAYDRINAAQQENEAADLDLTGPPAPPSSTPGTEVEQQAEDVESGLTPDEVNEYASAEALIDSLTNPEMSGEERNDLLVDWATANGIDLPKGWEEGKPPAAGEEGTPGDTWVRLVTGANAMYEVQRGEAEYVVWGGEIRTLPIIDVGDAQVQATQLDLTPVAASGTELPYINSNYLPSVVVKVGGQSTPMKAVPAQEPYPGLNFLQVTNESSRQLLRDEYGIEVGEDTQGFLTQDQVAQLDPAAAQALVTNGNLASVPFQVWTIQMPAYTDARGQRQLGSKWYQFPGTTRWSKDHLPFVTDNEDGTGLLGALATGYVGINEEAFTPNNPLPAIELDPDLMRGTTLVTAPFQPDVGLQTMELLQNQGLIGREDIGMGVNPQTGEVEQQPADGSMYRNVMPISEAVRRAMPRPEPQDIDDATPEQPSSGNPLSDILFGAADILGSLHSLTDPAKATRDDVAPAPAREQVELPTPYRTPEPSPLPRIGDRPPDREGRITPPLERPPVSRQQREEIERSRNIPLPKPRPVTQPQPRVLDITRPPTYTPPKPKPKVNQGRTQRPTDPQDAPPGSGGYR